MISTIIGIVTLSCPIFLCVQKGCYVVIKERWHSSCAKSIRIQLQE